MPGRLAERYHASLTDSELLAMRDDISLVDTRIAELLGLLDRTRESGQLWKEVNQYRLDFLAAQRTHDDKQIATALNRMLTAIALGAADFQRWAEIVDLLERRRKLVESEQKRLVAMQQMVTAEQAMTLVSALSNSLRTRVAEMVEPDAGQLLLAAVQRDLISILSSGVGQAANGGTAQSLAPGLRQS